jgi:hypothetical protein
MRSTMPNAPTKSGTVRCHGDKRRCEKSGPCPWYAIVDVKMTGKEMAKHESDPNHKKLKDSMTLKLAQHTLKHTLKYGKYDSMS